MIKTPDILFLTGIGLIFLYFILSAVFPLYFKRWSQRIRSVLLIIPTLLIIVSFIWYLISNVYLAKHSLPQNFGIVKSNIDSLDNELNADTVSLNKIDTLLTSIIKSKGEFDRVAQEHAELQKRIFIKQFNEKLSDSITKQLEEILSKIELKENFSVKTKMLTHNGKLLVSSGGKLLVTKAKVFNDIYTVDSVDVFPILKKINFKTNERLKELNFYIDSLAINFKMTRNIGEAINKDPDSLIFISISPYKEEYKRYHYFKNLQNEHIPYLDSIYFHENMNYRIAIDFPNTSPIDTLICFDFHLKRGLINSYCLSFK